MPLFTRHIATEKSSLMPRFTRHVATEKLKIFGKKRRGSLMRCHDF
jgi:hypothetical protein